MSADLAMQVCINILLAWSVQATMAAGALSFASAAFMAVGCYGSSVLTVWYGWPLVPAMVAGAAMAALMSVPVGLMTLGLRGAYFILATIGVTISTQVVLENVGALGGSAGFGGMMGAELGHALSAVAVVGAVLLLLSRTALQRVLDAVREDRAVAASLGVPVVAVRVAAFAAGAAIAGYAGGLYAHTLMFVRPESFGIQVGISATFFAILGGTATPFGPLLGAVVLTLLPEYVTALADWRPTVYGVAIILILRLRPRGLLPMRWRTA